MEFPTGRVTPASTDMLHPLHSSRETSNTNKISISLQNPVLWGLFTGDGGTVRTTADDHGETSLLNKSGISSSRCWDWRWDESTLLQGLETGWSKCTLGCIDRQRVGTVDGGRHSVKNTSRLSIPAGEKRPQPKTLWVPFTLPVLSASFCCAGCSFPLRKLQPQHPGGGEYTTKGNTELFRMGTGNGHACCLKGRG